MDVFFHSCGNVLEIVGDLIDVGMDVLDPVQPGAMNLDRAVAPLRWPRIVCRHDRPAKIMTTGSPAQVRNEVSRLIDRLGRGFGGGFVVGPANEMTPDIPPENLAAIFVAAHGV